MPALLLSAIAVVAAGVTLYSRIVNEEHFARPSAAFDALTDRIGSLPGVVAVEKERCALPRLRIRRRARRRRARSRRTGPRAPAHSVTSFWADDSGTQVDGVERVQIAAPTDDRGEMERALRASGLAIADLPVRFLAQ
ncbi:hypothetical protein [Microbacterium sp. JZ37]|uniref:hypothetical protein n=1 Tax=Microbacterium sp. JZ37 TaxID=2654193 RepID=UPI002B48529E|nr:hypothetical protein [Microbacterium sp. JZ37]WRH17411.1 hypothetical protein GC092_07720 [Microbacterium sp. JZ37]